MSQVSISKIPPEMRERMARSIVAAVCERIEEHLYSQVLIALSKMEATVCPDDKFVFGYNIEVSGDALLRFAESGTPLIWYDSENETKPLTWKRQ